MTEAVTTGTVAGASPPRRSRLVLGVSVAAAVIVAVLLAVLASSKPIRGGTGSPLIGKVAPIVEGPSLSGSGSYSLSQFLGRWVLLNFSASWCVPCEEETPQLLQFENTHQRRADATVLSVEFDQSDTPHLASFLKKSDADWPAVSDGQAQVGYGVSGIPTSYLIDPSGTVVARFSGGITAAQIDKVIRQADASA